MSNLSLIAVILGILSLTMQSSTAGSADFAIALEKSGEVLRCAMNSCNKVAATKAIAVMCNVGTRLKALKEITPLGLAQVATGVINGSLAIEPKCVDTSYFGCNKVVPPKILQMAEMSVRVGSLLGCTQNLSEDDKIKFAEYLKEYVQEITESRAKDLKCADVNYRALKKLGKYLEEICF